MPEQAAKLFGELVNEAQNTIVGARPRPDALWHYTSAEGLRGIITSNSLRFSEFTYMNDHSELLYGVSLFGDRLQAFISDKPEKHTHVAGQLKDRLVKVLDQMGAVIFCMCEEANLLNQWRDYGRDVVPYCIGFATSDLVTGSFNFDTYLQPIIYDPDQQIKIMDELLRLLYERALTIEGFGELPDEQADPYLQSAAIQVAALVLRFKNSAFSAEKEWRLITHLPEVTVKVHRAFRTSPLGVVPYYEWKRRGVHEQLPIVKIIVGPSPYGHVSENALRVFLNDNKYGSVATSHSTIPIR